MASWTTPVTHSTGDVLAVTDWNGVANNTTFNYQRPYFSAYYTNVGLEPASGTATQITLDAITASGYGFSLSSNNAIVPLTGVYSVSGAVTLNSVAGAVANIMTSYIYHNGSLAKVGSATSTATSLPQSSVSGLISCTAGDTLGLWVLQTSGSSIFIYPGNGPFNYLDVFFVGSQ